MRVAWVTSPGEPGMFLLLWVGKRRSRNPSPADSAHPRNTVTGAGAPALGCELRSDHSHRPCSFGSCSEEGSTGCRGSRRGTACPCPIRHGMRGGGFCRHAALCVPSCHRAQRRLPVAVGPTAACGEVHTPVARRGGREKEELGSGERTSTWRWGSCLTACENVLDQSFNNQHMHPHTSLHIHRNTMVLAWQMLLRDTLTVISHMNIDHRMEKTFTMC